MPIIAILPFTQSGDESTPGRETFEWIEIDTHCCENEYGLGQPGYPLDGISANQLAVSSPDYVVASHTFAAQDPAILYKAVLREPVSQSFLVTADTHIAMEMLVDTTGATGTDIRLYMQTVDGSGNPVLTWLYMLTGANGYFRTGYDSALNAVIESGDFGPAIGKRIALEIDIPAGELRFHATGKSAVVSSDIPAVGSRIVFSLGINDTNTKVPGEASGMTLVPRAWSMVLPYASGCTDVHGTVIAGAPQGVCEARLTESSPEKCFNTITTCQRTDNYLDGVKTFRFCRNSVLLPSDGEYFFPFLNDVRVTPAEINPGGGNRNSAPLGNRAKISVSLNDGPHSDNYVDRYQRDRIIGSARYDGAGYNPFERSTFWRKWAARNMYRLNIPLRYNSGYIDSAGVVTDVVTRDFITTGFSGPDNNGSVSFEGKDILTKVQNEKAQAPTASTGKLSAGIDNNDLSVTLTPSGVGALEYPAAGYVRIGEEIVSFTRSSDVLTIVRAQWGTSAVSHNAGETVQLCVHYDSLSPSAILESLLGYAGIEFSEYADSAQWQAEVADFLPRLYTTLISSPTGVAELLSEVSDQMYLYLWFDERDSRIKLRAVRPAASEAVTEITSNSMFDVDVKDQPDQLITRVVINYGLRNYAGDLKSLTNYSVTDVFVSLEEEGPTRSNGAMVKEIYSRWLESTDGAAATDLGNKLLARYKIPPRKITFSLDAKDRNLWVGDFISVTTDKSVGFTGLDVPVPAQVMAVSEVIPGTRYKYTAQQFVFEEPAADDEFSVDIAADQYNINLRTLFDDKYGVTPIAGDFVTFTVRSGVVVGSTSTATPSIDVGDWPSDVDVRLVNYGVVAGKGGGGGGGSLGSGSPESGGDAILTAFPITIDNHGVIGGGGGGGEGGMISGPAPKYLNYDLAAGGGAGATIGAAGSLNAPSPGNNGQWAGAVGTLYDGGAGGVNGNKYAGNGGDLGQNGGAHSTNVGWTWFSNGSAGTAGYAIAGYSFITFTNVGDIRGPTTG